MRKKTNKNILIVSQHFWPEHFRINELAQDLKFRGFSVSILAGTPNYPEGRIFKGYNKVFNRKQEWEGISIYRVPNIPRGKASYFGLFLN